MADDSDARKNERPAGKNDSAARENDSATSAEELRKAGQFALAEPLFRGAWERAVSALATAGKGAAAELFPPGPDCGWRLAYCLRKLGRGREAADVIETVVELWPDHEWARREAAWSLIEGRLKPAVDAGDVAAAVAAAARIVTLGADGLALERTIFAVVKVAKAKAAWQVVLEWTAHIDPGDLAPDDRILGGRPVMSGREQWYFARVKALLEAKRWDETVALADEALLQFPGRGDLLRWRALARAERGEPLAALAELRELAVRDRAWYVADALSEVAARCGELDEAWLAGARAAREAREPALAVKTLERLARIALDRREPEAALDHARLAVAVRDANGWPIRPALSEIVARAEREARAERPRGAHGEHGGGHHGEHGGEHHGEHGGGAHGEHGGGHPDGAPRMSLRELLERCRLHWQSAIESGQPRLEGTVGNLPEGKPFGFIKGADGADYFVLVRDIPAPCRVRGARVAFRVEETFDQKKNRPGRRAVAVEEVDRP